MQDPPDTKGKGFSVFRTAAEEVEMQRERQAADKERGRMSWTRGRVIHVAGAELPYVAVLIHHEREASEQSFATMREAEDFIKRNTPPPGPGLSSMYDRPSSDS